MQGYSLGCSLAARPRSGSASANPKKVAVGSQCCAV